LHADDILRGSPISLLFQSLSAESGWAKNWTRFTSTARDLAVYGTSSTLEHRTVSIPERSNRVCLHPSSPKGGPRGFESCSLQRRVKANSASGYNAPNVRPTHLRKTPAQGRRSYSRRAAPQLAACRAAGALELPLPPRLFSGRARTCPAARSDGVRLVLDVIRETCGVWRSRFPIGSGSRIY